MSSRTYRLSLAFVVALAARVSLAQDFTSNIVISSHHPTLQDAVDAAGEQGMLIVDQDYHNLQPLHLPHRFRMVGKGPQGRSALQFDNLSGASISIPDPGSAWVVIENLDIEGLYDGNIATQAIGIDFWDNHIVFLRNLTIRGFDYGIRGVTSFSIHVEDCNVSVNRSDNILLRRTCTSWRISGGLCSFSGRYGINVIHGNDNLIMGVRMESNPVAAIRTDTQSTHITHNRFECNQVPPFCPVSALAVLIDDHAEKTTLLENYYSGVVVEDNSSAQTTSRFENGYTVRTYARAGEDALHVRVHGDTEPAFVVDQEGEVRIGPDSGADLSRLTVRDPVIGLPSDPANHVASIENYAPAGNFPTNVLALSDRTAQPGPNKNFITFFGGGAPVGAVQGNGFGGVSLVSGGADFAEWIPRLRDDESIEPGDIVGIVGGRVTKDTRHAEQIHVVSTAPIVLGNASVDGVEGTHEPVALLGQVPVRVRGPVRAGDYIVASGKGDGAGIAVNPSAVTGNMLRRIAGRAWETSDAVGEKPVLAYVCDTLGAEATLSYVERLESQLADLSKRLSTLENAR